MEECTKDEIGVGAAMAAGSQGEKGNKALLVDSAKKRRSMKELLAKCESSMK